MRMSIPVLILIFAASAAFAAATSFGPDPEITSVVPNEGSVAGGTLVRITGAGFNERFRVFFGTVAYPGVPVEVEAPTVRFIDEHTLEVTTPPHFPAVTSIRVENPDHGDPAPPPRLATLKDAFTYTGDVRDGFEPILFPIFLFSVDGAFGSRFETTAVALNANSLRPISLYGVDSACVDGFGPNVPLALAPGLPALLTMGCSTGPGRLLWVAKVEIRSFAGNLRVTDVTRLVSIEGVEVPIVRESQFRDDQITLVNIPLFSRSRRTLRRRCPVLS